MRRPLPRSRSMHRGPSRHRRRPVRSVAAFVAGLVVALEGGSSGVAVVALAASPEPSPPMVEPSPSIAPSGEPNGEFDMEAWLDAPLPTDAPAGSTLDVGAFIVRDGAEPLRGVTLQVRLHPSTGTAEPTFDYAHQDFAGHVVAELEVPEGGVGALEIVLPGTMCENDVCGPVETLIPVRGVGPPPDAPLSLLATTLTAPPIAALVAGRALPFEITVQPKVAWPEPGMNLPSVLWLQVRVSRGPLVQEIAANLEDETAGRYTVPVTFREPGEYVLEAGTMPAAEGTDLLPGSLIRVTVQPESASRGPTLPTTSEEVPSWLVPGLIVLALAGLIVAATVTRRR